VDHLDGAAAQQIGQIAHLLDRDVVLPQIRGVGRGRPGLVRVVVERAAAKAIKMVIATLQRAEIGQGAQMPLADQGRLVAGPLQERRQGRVRGWQADLPRREGLFQADRQPVLVPPGDQRHAGGGADRGIGVGLQETQAVGRKAVDIGGAEITPPVAGHVGIAEIVGEDEQDVGL